MTTLYSWDPLPEGAQDSKEPSIAPNILLHTSERDTPLPEASQYQQKH